MVKVMGHVQPNPILHQAVRRHFLLRVLQPPAQATRPAGSHGNCRASGFSRHRHVSIPLEEGTGTPIHSWSKQYRNTWNPQHLLSSTINHHKCTNEHPHGTLGRRIEITRQQHV